MPGLKASWVKSERKAIESKDGKGKVIIRKGKNGGPVYEQSVVKVLSPK